MKPNVGVGLFVEDVGKMVAFYRDVLLFETDYSEGPFASFQTSNGVFFMFDRKQFARDIGEAYSAPRGINQTMEIGIKVSSTDEIDREYKRLMALGVRCVTGEPVTQPWGQRNFFIADPEGNLIEYGD